MEWLSRVLSKHQAQGRLNGITVARNAPRISHLFFADDCVLFLKATQQNLATVKRILEEFEHKSGQKLNLEKSTVFFGKNIDTDHADQLSRLLGVQRVETITKYLGLPIIFSNNKSVSFRGLEERMWKRANGWKEKMLSSAGKEILIKSILQSLPVYTMSCYKIPQSICKKLVSIIYNFWWGKGDGKHCIHWLPRKLLVMMKDAGGMSFKNLALFNDALLIKQGWRLKLNPGAIVSRVLKAKYFREVDFIESRLGCNPSLAWRCIWGAKEKVRTMGLAHQLTSVQDDDPMPQVRNIYKLLQDFSIREDTNTRGESSNRDERKRFWRKLWRIKVQMKIKIFIWRVFHNALPTADNLIKRGCQVDTICRVCNMGADTVCHILFYCSWAKSLWQDLFPELDGWRANSFDPSDWIWSAVCYFSVNQLATIFAGSYATWLNRNSVWHGKGLHDSKWVAQRVRRTIQETNERRFTFLTFSKDPGICWRPPEEGYIKINTDAAWNSQTRVAGGAYVCRAPDGCIISVWANSKEEVIDFTDAEAWAMRKAMEKAEELQWHRVIFETDCVNLVKRIELATPVKQGEGSRDALYCSKLMGKHRDWILNHILREGNELADALAKKAKDTSWSWITTDSLPFCLANKV